MKQVTKEEAIRIHDSKEWKNWSHEKKAGFQIRQKRLCMPFSVFRESVGEVLNRPVWTYEFASDEFIEEVKLATKSSTK